MREYDRAAHRAAVEAGYAPLLEYVAVETGGHSPPVYVEKATIPAELPQFSVSSGVSDFINDAERRWFPVYTEADMREMRTRHRWFAGLAFAFGWSACVLFLWAVT